MMDELSLAENIVADLCDLGHDAHLGEGEWLVVVHAKTGERFGINIEDLDA